MSSIEPTSESTDRVESSAGYASLLLAKGAYTKWINAHLQDNGCPEITDLFKDLSDGSKLLKLIEIFTGKKLPMEKGQTRSHHLLNVQKALDFLQNEGKIDLIGINSGAIVDGNQTSTMGLVWKMILYFEISGTGSASGSGKSPKAELLQWTQSLVNGYSGVNVTNFHTSWRDGMAFCALIHSQRPDLINYESCDPLQPVDNLEKAFSVAEKQLNVTRLFEPKDIIVPKPSEEAIMMYVSKLRHSFAVPVQEEKVEEKVEVKVEEKVEVQVEEKVEVKVEEKVEMKVEEKVDSPPSLVDQYNNLYSSLTNNIMLRRQLLASLTHSFSTTQQPQMSLNDFRSLRTTEDPLRMSEMESLGKMVLQLKDTNVDLPPIETLENMWLAAVNESNEYESLLLSQNYQKVDTSYCSSSLSIDAAIMVQVISVLVVMAIATFKD